MFNKQGLSHKLMAKWTEYSFDFVLHSARSRCMQSPFFLKVIFLLVLCVRSQKNLLQKVIKKVEANLQMKFMAFSASW